MHKIIKLFVIMALFLGSSSAMARIQEMTDAINTMRSNFGLGQLYWDDSLMYAAFVHARDMADGGYCDHGGLGERLSSGGWYGWGYGEVITCGVDYHWDSVYSWLNSVTHRNILLNGYYNHIGVSHYYGTYGHRWVVIVGQR